MQILSGIQFTTHFIEIFVVETKRFVGSFVNMILTRQTCGQRSSRAAESKRRALGNYFFERIYYMFLISRCRGDWDLGLCTSSGLSFVESQRYGKIRFFLCRNTFFSRKSPLRCGSPNASPILVGLCVLDGVQALLPLFLGSPLTNFGWTPRTKCNLTKFGRGIKSPHQNWQIGRSPHQDLIRGSSTRSKTRIDPLTNKSM